MTNKLKVSCQYTRKNNSEPCWYISDGGDKYMREDGTIHRHMTHDGGTYFATKEKAERCLAHWTDKPAAPKTPAEMSDAEIGATLRAHHSGQIVESYAGIFDWQEWDGVNLLECNQPVRVRPPEPVRETFTGHIRRFGKGWLMSTERIGSDTHRITFPVVDLEIPTGTYSNEDGERIVVERVND